MSGISDKLAAAKIDNWLTRGLSENEIQAISLQALFDAERELNEGRTIMKAVEEQQLLRSLKKIADNSERIAKSLEVIANAYRFESERSKRVNCGNCKYAGSDDPCLYCRNAVCWEPKDSSNGVHKEEVPFDDKV